MTILGFTLEQVAAILIFGCAGSLLAIPAWKGLVATARHTAKLNRSANKESEKRIQALARTMRASEEERSYLRETADREKRATHFWLFVFGTWLLGGVLNFVIGEAWIALGSLAVGLVGTWKMMPARLRADEVFEADKRVHLGLAEAEEQELDEYEGMDEGQKAEYLQRQHAEIERQRRDARLQEMRAVLEGWNLDDVLRVLEGRNLDDVVREMKEGRFPPSEPSQEA